VSSPPIRVVLADDHPIVLDGLAQLFGLEPDFEIVARCRDGDDAVRVLAAERPDLIVLDIRMPRLDGLAVLERIRRERLPTRALLLTAAIESAQVVEALRLGARGLVLKEMAPELLVQAARRVHAGGQWFDPSLVSTAVEGLVRRGGEPGASDGEKLTPREREIVAMVAQGARNRVIAERLGISEGTVKLHLHHVYEKLGLAGRVELLLFAQKHGFAARS
jgi:DNA-binding NarL/FixJ family response regulator